MDKAAIIADVEQTLAEKMPEVELVDIEVAGGRGNRLLRVFVDRPGGVDHEVCARVTALLGRYLEDHTVEVSSPGLERRLRKPEHFRDAVGKKINLKTYGPVQGQRNFTGFLVSVGENELRIEADENEKVIPFDEIASAKLVFEFETTDKPGCRRVKKRRKR